MAQWCAALGLGLLGANVLVVNNYRDRSDDEAVGKRTLAVRWGDRAMVRLYALNAAVGMALTVPVWAMLNVWLMLIPVAIYGGLFVPLSRRMQRERTVAQPPSRCYGAGYGAIFADLFGGRSGLLVAGGIYAKEHSKPASFTACMISSSAKSPLTVAFFPARLTLTCLTP